ncbi:integral membrane protein [Colletotrichum incanum]|uniref:Integral membrane protein n=1 Tax=Colletotrichum incanum TaxID=1573173 RepID=A0A162NDZ5_COLIC|nr:integral membrane protein [Colletotrichum incanum]OHW90100.1 integral membrane protein [Colletotrichum incanum]
MAAVTPPNPLPPDENVNPVLLGISGVLIFFVIFTTSIRLYVRFSLRHLGWDDYLMAVVASLGIVRYGVQCAQGASGNGRHRWYISTEDYVHNNMLGWFAQILLFSSICLLKCSIMLLLLRIKNSSRLKFFLWAVMAGLIITNFGVIIILLAECDPVDAYWTGVGKCWDAKIRIYSIYLTISYSVLTDLLCSFLPLVVVWQVRIPLSTKLSVGGLMSLGLIATGFGIARAASLGLKTSDLSYVYAVTAIWSNLELYLGIIAGNLALSRSLWFYFFGEKQVPTYPSAYGQSSHRSRSAYNNSRLHGDNADAMDTYIRSERRPSVSKSDHSDIPLEPGIQKRTEIWISEEDAESDSPGSATRKPSKQSPL